MLTRRVMSTAMTVGDGPTGGVGGHRAGASRESTSGIGDRWLRRSQLDVLLDDPTGQHHGFAVAKAAGLQTGTLYPIMARLERAGWMTSNWEDGDPAARGPRRRLYRLTDEGAVAAHAALREHPVPRAKHTVTTAGWRRLRPARGWAT